MTDMLHGAGDAAAIQTPLLTIPDTYFAPAGRDAPDELRRKMEAVQSIPYIQQTLDAMPSMVVILNDARQIVAANQALTETLGANICDLLGRRPGEAIGCARVKTGPDGCGTSKHCAACGAVHAILESQACDQKVVRECRILIDKPAGTVPLDLQVTATRMTVGSDRFVVLAITDVSQSNRLAVLQRIFFHDVLNTAGCIHGYFEYLFEETPENEAARTEMMQLADSLTEAIQSQRDLVLAESGDLKPQPVPMQTSAVLEELRSQYQKHPLAEGRMIEAACGWDGTVVADRHLLYRVLGNMLKNALEATTPGNSVRIGCCGQDDDVVFAVHNPEVMPEEVQLQIFQRSFSTKGTSGRGIGTHSMKLLGEQYLAGKVGFSSQPTAGTTFWLAIPKGPPN